MSNFDLKQSQNDITTILTRNASFYSEGPEDETLYYIDPITIWHLAYEIMQYVSTVFGAVLPLVSGAGWARAYLEKRRTRDRPPAPSGQPAVPDQYLKDELPDVVRVRLESLRGRMQDVELQKQIHSNVQEILEFHGWPPEEAAKDADLILSALKPAPSAPAKA